MKEKIFVISLIILSFNSCDNKEEILPSNFIQVNIDGTNYTFIGRSILEPLTLFSKKDTLKNTTYLGGFIGTCLEGSTQFIDIRINKKVTGAYELSDGIEFWMETESHYFLASNRSENHKLSLSINEYGDESGRISGIFSGSRNSNDNPITLTGEFSLARLPDNSITFEVASELCK